MGRLLTSIGILCTVLAGAALLGGEDVLRLADEVARQVHSTVDWSDPESVTLDRYSRALGLTLGPLAHLYEAASNARVPVDVVPARNALAAARVLAAEAAADAPEGLHHLEPLFADYLDAAGALLEIWDTEAPPETALAATFGAQHTLHAGLQDAEEARLLRDLRAQEDDRGYPYQHRLTYYRAYRLVRCVTDHLVPAGALRSALEGVRVADGILGRFVAAHSRLNDDFAPFVDAATAFSRAARDLAVTLNDPPNDLWITIPNPGPLLDAFAELRARRGHLLRLERTGEL